MSGSGINNLWALKPAVFSQLLTSAADIDAAILPPITARGQRNNSLQVLGGIAVISIQGILETEPSLFSFLFGGTAFSDLQEQLRQAAVHPEVIVILLNIDSPGGTVAGTAETAALITELAKVKPVFAYGSGDVTSAAYWLASAADRIVVSPTTGVGSIGVVANHIDFSIADERAGRKVTEIVSGQFKRIASSHAPLSEAGRAVLQSQVDTLTGIFVETVRRNRNLSKPQVEQVSEGTEFIGQQAVSVGLIDGLVRNFDEVLAALVDEMPAKASPASTAAHKSTEDVYETALAQAIAEHNQRFMRK